MNKKHFFLIFVAVGELHPLPVWFNVVNRTGSEEIILLELWIAEKTGRGSTLNSTLKKKFLTGHVL